MFTHTFLQGGKDKATPFSSRVLLGDCDSGSVFTETDTGIAVRLTQVTVTSVGVTHTGLHLDTPPGPGGMHYLKCVTYLMLFSGPGLPV